MSDERALLAAIRDNPDEDTPRLAYADWLDEYATTDAQHARAEFIRVQVARAGLPAHLFVSEEWWRLHRREEELKGLFGAVWLADWPRNATFEYAERGFLKGLWLGIGDCLTAPVPPWYREPVATAHLSGEFGDLKTLLSRDWLDGVAGLDIGVHCSDGDGVIKALVTSSCVGSLHSFYLSSDGFTDTGLVRLTNALRQVRSLELTGCFSAGGWERALKSPMVGQLRELSISHRLGHMARYPPPGAGLADVLARAHFDNLQSLELQRCDLGDRVAALGYSKRFTTLRKLDLTRDHPGPDTWLALAEGRFAALRELDLFHCGFSDLAAGQIARGSMLASLESLCLFSNHLTANAVELLVESGKTAKLQTLQLCDNSVGDEGAEVLAKCEHFPELRWLILEEVNLSDRGARAILQAPWADQLAYLRLDGNHFSEAGRELLRGRFGNRVEL